MVIVEVADFSVVDEVAVLSTAVVKVAPVLEGVVVKVAFFPKVVVMIGRLHWRVCLLGQPVVECD